MKQTSKNIITLLTAFLAINAISFAKPVSPETLASDWTFHGIGTSAAQNRMFYMEESEGSKGVMIVSPEAYEGDVAIRYEIMPMSAASVCVVILHASDTGEATSLTLPENYDGSMGHWINNIDNYFFAFHNAAHDRTPFAIKFPARQPIGEFGMNIMRNGEFHTVEVTRKGDMLSFAVNGKELFSGNDSDPLQSGHIAFRIRGISQQPASCLLRNVEITSLD